jgi:hypothetical protein
VGEPSGRGGQWWLAWRTVYAVLVEPRYQSSSPDLRVAQGRERNVRTQTSPSPIDALTCASEDDFCGSSNTKRKEEYRADFLRSYIGDAKNGRLVGTDSMGNRYYENLDATQEIPGMSSVHLNTA